MKIGIRNDIVQVYKDVHIWVGIVSSLMLFVAFYAGAITMFEKPLERWATPPSALPAPPSLEHADKLLSAVLAAHPQAAADYMVMVHATPEQPARVLWRERGARPRSFVEYGAAFAADGSVQVEKLRKAEAANWVDTVHQLVGLPFPDIPSRMIMGAVSLMYAVALLSGLIVLLPTLLRDAFALRIGKNLKRMWLDVHNALGIFSLPFHLAIALTSVVFAFHSPFYAAQAKLVYPDGIHWDEHASATPPPGAQALATGELLRRVESQLPDLRIDSFGFRRDKAGHLQATLSAQDPRHGTRARTYVAAPVDPYTGVVDKHDLPGYMDGWDASLNAFFMVHFGSFGGAPVRWLYLLMGLAGAALFYSGNLLWVESRRRKQRGANALVPAQKRSARMLADLTVGVSLGCVAGISATIAAAKWLPSRVENLAAWHEGIYFAVFAAAAIWAFLRHAPRAACELLWLCALATLLIPLSSLAGVFGIGGAWNQPGTVAIDLTASVAIPVFMLLAQRTRRRMLHGDADSVWSLHRPVATAPSREAE